MKNHITTTLLAFMATVSIFTFTSCDKDNAGDTTKPVIVLNKPAEGAVLKIGSHICLDMDLSDNEALASYKVNIHNADDGHGHSRAEGDEEVVFSYQKSWSDIAGLKNTHIHSHEIEIPANAKPGKYHLMVYCTDASKNETWVARNIVLSHEGEDHDHDHDHEH